MKNVFCYILFVLCLQSFAQNSYTSNSNGRVFNSDSKKIAPETVRLLLNENTDALTIYNEGRTKKTVGNVLLLAAPLFIIADLAKGLTTATEYPTVLTYLGIAAFVIAIPVKIGFSKKIKTAVNRLNNSNLKPKTASLDATTIIANSNGIGVSISF